MDPIHQLASLFARFPGIGARQSRRFVYFLLKQDKGYVNELVRLINELEDAIAECSVCHRYAPQREIKGATCSICVNPSRDEATLLVIEKDADLDAVERSATYRGRYFVLGGILPILEKEPEKKIRVRELAALLSKNDSPVTEVILASSMTPEGDHTADYVRDAITSILEKKKIKLTTLGRGLSTGTELEYSDADTLRWALEGRK